MRLPSKPTADGDAASEALIQYVDAEFSSPPDRFARAKDEVEARRSGVKWARWVGSTFRNNLEDELKVQRAQSPQDPVRIAALEAALAEIKGW